MLEQFLYVILGGLPKFALSHVVKMKNNRASRFFVTMFAFGALTTALAFMDSPDENEPDGAWAIESYTIRDSKVPDGATGTLIFAGKYYYWALFDERNKQFFGASGGTFKKGGNTLEYEVIFHTLRPDLIGQRLVLTKRGSRNKWTLQSSQGIVVKMKRIKEKADSPLMGGWRITQREQNGEMIEISDGPRKTIKMLSNERFQWAAFNTETQEFLGTGGGTYSISEDKYTESISYFSRDSTQVGMSLSFDYELDEEGNDWHHSGRGSRGNPITEVWRKIN